MKETVKPLNIYCNSINMKLKQKSANFLLFSFSLWKGILDEGQVISADLTAEEALNKSLPSFNGVRGRDAEKKKRGEG